METIVQWSDRTPASLEGTIRHPEHGMTLKRLHQVPIETLGLPRSGRAYDLASGWWNGMPVAPAHPPFQLITYRTPQGERNQGAFPFLPGENAFNCGFRAKPITRFGPIRSAVSEFSITPG